MTIAVTITHYNSYETVQLESGDILLHFSRFFFFQQNSSRSVGNESRSVVGTGSATISFQSNHFFITAATMNS